MGNGMCSRCTYGLETFGIVLYVVLGIFIGGLYFVTSIQPLIMKDKSDVQVGEHHNICWRGLATLQVAVSPGRRPSALRHRPIRPLIPPWITLSVRLADSGHVLPERLGTAPRCRRWGAVAARLLQGPEP